MLRHIAAPEQGAALHPRDFLMPERFRDVRNPIFIPTMRGQLPIAFGSVLPAPYLNGVCHLLPLLSEPASYTSRGHERATGYIQSAGVCNGNCCRLWQVRRGSRYAHIPAPTMKDIQPGWRNR